jgi:hypothetical protein
MIAVKVLPILMVMLATACASVKSSFTTLPPLPVRILSKLAIAPGSGVLGDAVAGELRGVGFAVVDVDEAVSLISRRGLKEADFVSAASYSILYDAGVEAVVEVKSAIAEDGTPESGAVIVTSTWPPGLIIAARWRNGGGGQSAPEWDAGARKKLSDVAREICRALLVSIRRGR